LDSISVSTGRWSEVVKVTILNGAVGDRLKTSDNWLYMFNLCAVNVPVPVAWTPTSMCPTMSQSMIVADPPDVTVTPAESYVTNQFAVPDSETPLAFVKTIVVPVVPAAVVKPPSFAAFAEPVTTKFVPVPRPCGVDVVRVDVPAEATMDVIAHVRALMRQFLMITLAA
jgi:hypothetical protein